MAILRIPIGHKTAFCYGVLITYTKCTNGCGIGRKSQVTFQYKKQMSSDFIHHRREIKQKNLQHVGTLKMGEQSFPAIDQEDLILGTNSGTRNLLDRLPSYLPMCGKVTDN